MKVVKAEYTIITVLSDQSLVKFQQKVKEFCENKVIEHIIVGVSLLPIQTNAGIGIQAMPYAYIEHVSQRKSTKPGELDNQYICKWL